MKIHEYSSATKLETIGLLTLHSVGLGTEIAQLRDQNDELADERDRLVRQLENARTDKPDPAYLETVHRAENEALQEVATYQEYCERLESKITQLQIENNQLVQRCKLHQAREKQANSETCGLAGANAEIEAHYEQHDSRPPQQRAEAYEPEKPAKWRDGYRPSGEVLAAIKAANATGMKEATDGV